VTLASASAAEGTGVGRRPALERLASSLPLFATLALVAVFLLAVTPGFIVQDTWLALVAGREIVDHGLPSHDALTILAAGHRWVDQQWLGQLLLYGLSAAGGMKAVVLVASGAALTAWGLAIVAAGRKGPAAPGVVTVLVVAGVLSSPWALQVRTQELALPLYATVLWLLLTDPLLRRRRTWSVLPLLVLWANIHGSVALGVAVVWIYALAALRAPARRRLVPYLAAPLALLVSPYGFGLVGYYRLMLFSAPFRRFISEWQPSRPSVITAVFYALAATTLVAVIRRRRTYHLGELLVLLLTSVAAAWAMRNIVWFALSAAAILPVREGGERFRGMAAGTAALAVACVIPATAAIALAKPPSYWQGNHVSAAAVAAIRPLLPSTGPVFADDSHADWLLWNFPQLRGRVVYDDRVELLSASQLETLQRVLYHHARTFGACLVVAERDSAGDFSGRIVWSDRRTAVIEMRARRCRR
jgi:hypothetical protein